MTRKIQTLVSVLFIICGIGFTSCQEVAVVPELVTTAFDQKYSDETATSWEVDAHGNYEAHFENEGIKYRADFTPEGMWIETEVSIKKKDLPKLIKDILKKDYDYSNISEVEKVEHHEKGLFYDVEFKQKGKNVDVEFDSNGKVLNQ